MRRAIIVTYDGAATLDVTGPAEVFGGANQVLGKTAYEILITSVGGGEVAATSSLTFRTQDLLALRPRSTDTVVVAGGMPPALERALADTLLREWLCGAAKKIERLTSVCSGSFLLAAAGLLNGRRAATHWMGAREFQKRFPEVELDAKAIFVRDGSVWTSAGVTTGIDMALALVEEDYGRTVADRIAAVLVLYLRRPGFQAQFSAELTHQRETSEPLRPAVDWIRSNLRKANVDTLAENLGLSVRTLHRRCLSDVGLTPAKLIEQQRLEHARTLLETTNLAVKVLATECGFGSPAHLTRAFERELGISPREYRLLHGKAA